MSSSNFETQLILVDLSDIHTEVQIKNIREYMDSKTISDLADSIKQFGLQNPLTITESELVKEDGSVEEVTELVSGRMRLEAIKLIKKAYPAEFNNLFSKGIPCIEYRGSLEDAILVNAVENLQRTDPKEGEICKWIFDRVGDGYTQREVANFINM